MFPFPVLERLGASTLGHAAGDGSDTTLARRARRFLWRLGQRATRAWVDLRRVRQPFGQPSDAGAALFFAPEARLSATADGPAY